MQAAGTAAADAATTNDWIEVCTVADIPIRGARVLTRPGGADIAVFRTGDGRVFALLDRCPHKGGPLSQGIVHGARVTCPLHAWSIGLDDGEAAAPDVGCAMRFAVRVVDGSVLMDAGDLRGRDPAPR